MSKAEDISYAIEKECSRMSLVDWCEELDFTIEEFYRFLNFGKKCFEASEVGEKDGDTD